MPSWTSLLDDINRAGTTYDVFRRKHLKELHEKTKRNTIVYYSGWLQKAGLQTPANTFLVNDNDKNGLMATIHGLDRKLGLDIFFHTPGGDIAATESLVDYLRSMFDTDIRAIVPQLAMSAGAMIALSCKEIIMGKHSSLGPIDPQIFGIPAHGIIEEFKQAAEEIKNDTSGTRILLWKPIIGKYNPTLLGECQKAIDWSNEMVREWLVTGMFRGEQDAHSKADQIVNELGSHALTKSHARHISLKKAQDMGIRIVALENDQDLQEKVLTVHHACIQTLSATLASKIIENHNGVSVIETIET